MYPQTHICPADVTVSPSVKAKGKEDLNSLFKAVSRTSSTAANTHTECVSLYPIDHLT